MSWQNKSSIFNLVQKNNKAVSVNSIYILIFSDSAEINAELNQSFTLTYCECIHGKCKYYGRIKFLYQKEITFNFKIFYCDRSFYYFFYLRDNRIAWIDSSIIIPLITILTDNFYCIALDIDKSTVVKFWDFMSPGSLR